MNIRTSLALFGALAASACGGSQEQTCPPGQYFDANYGQCIQGGAGPQCPQGQMWNGAQCVYAGGGAQQCPAGQVFNGAQCVPQGGGVQCPAGQTWNGTACAPAGGTTQCPAGQTWNGAACVPAGGGTTPTAGGCTGQATPVAIASIPGGDAIIRQAAASYVPPGSQPVGSPLAGNFQAGQCLEYAFQAEAGKCYTAVAASAGGIADLDVELTTNLPAPVPNQVIAQDQDDAPIAVMGGNPNCFTPPLPGPVKLIVRAQGGQGLAGVQLYAR